MPITSVKYEIPADAICYHCKISLNSENGIAIGFDSPFDTDNPDFICKDCWLEYKMKYSELHDQYFKR